MLRMQLQQQAPHRPRPLAAIGHAAPATQAISLTTSLAPHSSSQPPSLPTTPASHSPASGAATGGGYAFAVRPGSLRASLAAPEANKAQRTSNVEQTDGLATAATSCHLPSAHISNQQLIQAMTLVAAAPAPVRPAVAAAMATPTHVPAAAVHGTAMASSGVQQQQQQVALAQPQQQQQQQGKSIAQATPALGWGSRVGQLFSRSGTAGIGTVNVHHQQQQQQSPQQAAVTPAQHSSVPAATTSPASLAVAAVASHVNQLPSEGQHQVQHAGALLGAPAGYCLEGEDDLPQGQLQSIEPQGIEKQGPGKCTTACAQADRTPAGSPGGSICPPEQQRQHQQPAEEALVGACILQEPSTALSECVRQSGDRQEGWWNQVQPMPRW